MIGLLRAVFGLSFLPGQSEPALSMLIRVWDSQLKVFWYIKSISFDDQNPSEPEGFEGWRNEKDKTIRIDIGWSDRFEIKAG